jgi:hypothetical protein
MIARLDTPELVIYTSLIKPSKLRNISVFSPNSCGKIPDKNLLIKLKNDFNIHLN